MVGEPFAAFLYYGMKDLIQLVSLKLKPDLTIKMFFIILFNQPGV